MEIPKGKSGNETGRNQLVDIVGVKVLDYGGREKDCSADRRGIRQAGDTGHVYMLTCDFGSREWLFHNEQLRATLWL